MREPWSIIFRPPVIGTGLSSRCQRQPLRPYTHTHLPPRATRQVHGLRSSSSSSNNNNNNSPSLSEEMKSRHIPTRSGPWQTSNIHDLHQSLKDHLDLEPLETPSLTLIPPGFHHVTHNIIVEESQLCEDGAERRHAPGNGDEWKFRVWAGGHMKFAMPLIHADTNITEYVCGTEKITNVRVLGDPKRSKDAKILVTLTKSYFGTESSSTPESETEPKSDSGSASTLLIRENKHLCFMRHVPPSLQSPLAGATGGRRLPPPSSFSAPFHAQTMTPSRTLLFRFSALSQNAHAIHLDADFTRRVYGIPNLLVQGPLTSVLMLEVLRKALALFVQQSGQLQSSPLVVREFEYKNLLPLFVDEPMTIACKRAESGQGSAAQDRWDVWIQKGQGENEMLAVKGKALVAPVPGPQKAHNNRNETGR
ncbi:hypothetical protein HRR78_007111 [Exophiala dermatitidis]|nr:hypothetical protein HRR75_008104 [Exophiala dermatitidis]KAJ4541833.1 hypothetical protein HRR78_007111 [Exophiala dermatitidis]